MNTETTSQRSWYREVTRYQWLVLFIASLGWIFDIFEGQIFVTSMNEAMPSLLPDGTPESTIRLYNRIALAAFLLGGATGGVLFGMLSDRIGRTKTMIITILVYSLFTSITAFSQSAWQMIVLRFLVAMGVGGEWAVASAMVAEVFPHIARARSLGIFHATSVFGSYLAIAAGAFIVANRNLATESIPDLYWRLGFLIGALPALLTIWIRLQLREPERWIEAKVAEQQSAAKKTGRILELFSSGLLRNTFVGVSLATVGLATFWGVRIYGKDLMRATAERMFAAQLPDYLTQNGKPITAVLDGDLDKILLLMPPDTSREENIAQLEQIADSITGSSSTSSADVTDQQRQQRLTAGLKEMAESIKRWEMLGHFLVITGGLPGLLLFGPLSERIGRRPAFLFFCVGGFLSSIFLFTVLHQPGVYVLCVALPVFGCLTIGMHAGFAVYFPELFPTRLRGTGGGFCFNMGRLIASPTIILSGVMLAQGNFSLEQTTSLLSLLFLVGVVILFFAPETKGKDLPE